MAKSIAAFNHRATPSPEDEDAAKRSSAMELSGTAVALSGALRECQRVAAGGARRTAPAFHRLPVTVADDGFFVDANGIDVFPAGLVLLSGLFTEKFLMSTQFSFWLVLMLLPHHTTPHRSARTTKKRRGFHSYSLSSYFQHRHPPLILSLCALACTPR